MAKKTDGPKPPMEARDKFKKLLALVAARMQTAPRGFRSVRVGNYEASDGDLLLAVEQSLAEAKRAYSGEFPPGFIHHPVFSPSIDDLRVNAYLRLLEDAARLVAHAVPDTWVEGVEEGDISFKVPFSPGPT